MIYVYIREKRSSKTSFQLGMGLNNGQKQGRDEKRQEVYPAAAEIHNRCRIVFLRSFISALFLSFFQTHPYITETKFYRNFSPSFCSFLGVF